MRVRLVRGPSEAGVREYWIVDPLTKTVEGRLDGSAYTRVAERDGKLESAVVPGWYVKPAWLWAEPRPSVLATVEELGVALAPTTRRA